MNVTWHECGCYVVDGRVEWDCQKTFAENMEDLSPFYGTELPMMARHSFGAVSCVRRKV